MVPQIWKKAGTVAEPAKSRSGCIGEYPDMKKASGKLGFKPSKTDSPSFVDELSESQHLQERLRAIVSELKATVHMLERNLAEARSSVQSPRKARSPHKAKKPSGSKTNESIMGDELENRDGNDGEEIVPSNPVRTRKGARS